MKKLTIYAVALCGLLIAGNLVSCESKKNDEAEYTHSDANDSKEMAQEQNEEKFDDSDIKKDAKFCVNAADGGMLEVEAAKLAQTKGVSQVVKNFAKHLEEDHSKANEELKAIALSKSISLPDAISEKNQKKLDELNEKSGKDFDKEFIDLMVSDHKDDIDLFEKESEKGNDPELKAFASGKLPTLRQHLKMAEDAEKALKK